jgi:uncharacterized protein (TIGR00251 family)
VKISKHDGAITFDVRVIPRSSKSEIVGEIDGVIKIKLKAPPVDGAANEELVRLISKELEISRSSIDIVAGHASKQKRVRIKGRSADEVRKVLSAKT